MTLRELVAVLRRHDQVVRARDDEATITGLAVDSRKVRPGTLFIAVRGTTTDGHRFIGQAVASGAAAVVAEQEVDAPIPTVVVRDGKAAAQRLAEAWYRAPARELDLVAVTGTNGKTTTTAIMRHLLDHDHDAGTIGTLGAFDGRGAPVESSAGSLTTPGPLELQATLRGLIDHGVRSVAMEASSHALDQGRLDGLTFVAGIFTNLTHEHLDYHRTLDDYLGAKLRLADLVAAEGILSVNADDPAWRSLRADGRAVSWGAASDADVATRDPVYTPTGTRFTLGGRFGTREIAMPLIGDFNVANAAGAATVALARGMPIDAVMERLATAPQVPGRMEQLASQPFVVLRDYMHTPDAYQRVLGMLRPLVPGRLWVLFGCGGNRDAGKRPVMGRIAAEFADRVVLTTDNPRHEDPDRIIDDIVAGMPAGSFDRILDREEAIARTLERARPGDTVLLAGKGHETYQIEGDTKRHFDEREIVRALLP